MLVLSRKKHQTIVLNDNIELTIVEVKRNTVRLAISAPDDIKILRGELVPFEIDVTTGGETAERAESTRTRVPKKSKAIYRKGRKATVARRLPDLPNKKTKGVNSLSDYRARSGSNDTDQAKEEQVVYEVVIN